MDLNLYNIQYLEGLFENRKAQHYTANMEKGIDTSGVAILYLIPAFRRNRRKGLSGTAGISH